MVVFPNCKINLGLQVVAKRADGFHNIETIFYPINIKDAIEIIENKEERNEEIIFTQSGNSINVDDNNNLCVKAYKLLKKDFPQIPNIKLHLLKNIPMGAGLGGGSANASSVLILLNNLFKLNITQQKLIDYALTLGSDCPFFIINKPCYATGRGEILNEIEIDLTKYKIVILNPRIHINTGIAFSNFNSTNYSQSGSLANIINTNIYDWKNNLKNDFEQTVFQTNPILKEIKESMYAQGAIYSAMSGTGSTIFAIFEKTTLLQLKYPAHYFYQIV